MRLRRDNTTPNLRNAALRAGLPQRSMHPVSRSHFEN
jgi:hypothetical protein